MDWLRISAVVTVTPLLAAAACTGGGGERREARVVDRVRALEIALPARGSLARCLELTPFRHGRVIAIERLGRVTRSVTVTQRGSRALFACDETGVKLERREWCGFSAGALRDGRLADPRLNILCVDRHRRHVASVFVNPVRGARWISVDQGPYTELFPTARGLPVRVASTHDVDYGRARATFRISQIGPGGRILVRRRFVAQVAG